MLKQIKYFQTVVRLNSFSKAAEECYISQSAISQQVQSLERELGVELLKRENRRFSLTPAGEYFYKKSLILTADYDRLCRETLRVAKGCDAVLRVGYVRGYGGQELQHALARFAALWPDVSVDMKTGNHEELYKLLRDDRVDLVLNDQRRAFSQEYVNMILSSIGCEIEISTRDPIAQLDHVNADELKNVPCILVTSKEQEATELTHYREIYGLTGEVFFAETIEEARLMVIGGKGFMPIEGGGRPVQYEELLARIPLCRDGAPIVRNYCAFWKKNNPSGYIQSFADVLQEQFTQDKADA